MKRRWSATFKKGYQHFLQGRQQIFRFIKDHSRIFLVEKMCSVLKVSRGGFYKWTVNSPSKRSVENQTREAEVLRAFENSKKIYGSPRITLELHRKHIKNSRSLQTPAINFLSLKHIGSGFKPGVLGAVWVSDITYIRTKKGWLYLITVIDLGDRRIIG